LAGGESPMSAGICVLIIGLVFTWIFFPFHLSKQWLLDIGPSKVVPGKVLSVQPSNWENNGARVMEHRFAYELESGAHKEGTAYTSGGNWEAGTPLQVRYLVSIPDLAVPEGARLGPNSVSCAVVLFFPLAGIGLAFAPAVQRFADLKVLRMGSLATGRITSVERTSAEAGDKTRYKIHVTCIYDGLTLVRRTQDTHEVVFAMRKQDEGEPVEILYVPHKSGTFVMPELWSC
jgi:hypothetical protein